MWKLYFDGVVFVVLGICMVAQCRKYDIEKESYRLYGMNTKLVLQQIRKTPEYLNILNGKIKELKDKINFMMLDILYSTTNELQIKVQEMILGVTINAPARKFRGYNDLGARPGKLRNRQIARNVSSVQFLESHSQLNRVLTLKQRNALRDVGFECAGKVIHTLIKHSQPDGVLQASTQQPYGGEGKDTTPEVYTPHTHVVTSESDTEATTPNPEHQEEHPQRTRRPETFRNFRASETNPFIRNTTLF